MSWLLLQECPPRTTSFLLLLISHHSLCRDSFPGCFPCPHTSKDQISHSIVFVLTSLRLPRHDKLAFYSTSPGPNRERDADVSVHQPIVFNWANLCVLNVMNSYRTCFHQQISRSQFTIKMGNFS